MLTVSGISKSFGERLLFSDLSFALYAGDRLGIIGPNGSGKTTLLDIVAGLGESDTGTVSLARGMTIGYLEQSLSFDRSIGLLDEVTSVRTDEQRLEKRRRLIHDRLTEIVDAAEQEALVKELGAIEERLELSGAYSAGYEAKKILAGLGFTETDY